MVNPLLSLRLNHIIWIGFQFVISLQRNERNMVFLEEKNWRVQARIQKWVIMDRKRVTICHKWPVGQVLGSSHVYGQSMHFFSMGQRTIFVVSDHGLLNNMIDDLPLISMMHPTTQTIFLCSCIWVVTKSDPYKKNVRVRSRVLCSCGQGILSYALFVYS
jgi:hypothetical protein